MSRVTYNRIHGLWGRMRRQCWSFHCIKRVILVGDAKGEGAIGGPKPEGSLNFLLNFTMNLKAS